MAVGAEVIAITASKSPLARKATVAIGLDHVEDGQTFISMIARILQLVVIDVLAVGVALQRGAENPERAINEIAQHDDERPFEPESPRSRISHVTG